jgi:TIR domain
MSSRSAGVASVGAVADSFRISYGSKGCNEAGVTEESNAVFLSYASEDCEAAERIADALKVAGIEVWFDKGDLRGGDAWDRKIRDQIRDCRLFIPVISANTERRDEGYFRREWALGADRTRDMAHRKTFLVPVVIDGTPERGASVPEKFDELQWTRLWGGETSPAFVERIKKLLTPEYSATTAQRSKSRPMVAPSASRSSLRKAVIWSGATLVLACACLVAYEFWFSVRRVPPIVPAVTTAKSTAPSAEVAQAFNPPPHSVAVLPFTNLSGDPKQDYFSDGISEEGSCGSDSWAARQKKWKWVAPKIQRPTTPTCAAVSCSICRKT